jgi:uncharacterized alkaline shock family protein YloU
MSESSADKMSETSPVLTKGTPATEGHDFGEDESFSVDALASGESQDRGSLTIADRVVEKVAGAAAHEVDHVTGVPRRVLGQTLGKVRPDSQARATAKVDGSVVSVSVSVAIEYPTPVRQAAAEVRRRVMDQVGQICGLQVVDVHVDVPHFYSAAVASPPARRVQ